MDGSYDYNKELEYQLQVGPRLFPEYPVRSINQSFYELKKALGIASSKFHSISITREQYQNDHYVCAVDTEKIIEASFTGLNTKSGDLLTIRCKPANAPLNPNFFAATKNLRHVTQR